MAEHDSRRCQLFLVNLLRDYTRKQPLDLLVLDVTRLEMSGSGRSRAPHRPALTHAQAVRLLTNESPGEFDPVLITAFATAARHFDEVFQSGKR